MMDHILLQDSKVCMYRLRQLQYEHHYYVRTSNVKSIDCKHSDYCNGKQFNRKPVISNHSRLSSWLDIDQLLCQPH